MRCLRWVGLLVLLAVFMLTIGCSPAKEPEKKPTVALRTASSEVSVGEIFTVDVVVKQVKELASIGVKVKYPVEKLEVTELDRDDSWLSSNGGTVQQMEFSNNTEHGYVKIVLGIFPANKYVGDESQTEHRIASIKFKAISVGNAALDLSIDNNEDSDLGIFDSHANLVSDVVDEDLTVNIR